MRPHAVFRSVVVLLAAAAAFAALAEPVTVAVLYFDNNSLMDKERYDGLRKGLCDMMITELSKIEGLKVVERAELEKVLKEVALGQSGVIDESTAPQVGRMLGAGTLFLGSFMKDMGANIRIDTRLVEVESGKVLKAEEVSGSAQKVFKLIKKLVFKLAEGLDVEVSRDDRKRIEGSDLVTIEVLQVYSEGLEALDAGDRTAAQAKFEECLKADPKFERARTQIARLREAK